MVGFADIRLPSSLNGSVARVGTLGRQQRPTPALRPGEEIKGSFRLYFRHSLRHIGRRVIEHCYRWTANTSVADMQTIDARLSPLRRLRSAQQSSRDFTVTATADDPLFAVEVLNLVAFVLARA